MQLSVILPLLITLDSIITTPVKSYVIETEQPTSSTNQNACEHQQHEHHFEEISEQNSIPHDDAKSQEKCEPFPILKKQEHQVLNNNAFIVSTHKSNNGRKRIRTSNAGDTSTFLAAPSRRRDKLVRKGGQSVQMNYVPQSISERFQDIMQSNQHVVEMVVMTDPYSIAIEQHLIDLEEDQEQNDNESVEVESPSITTTSSDSENKEKQTATSNVQYIIFDSIQNWVQNAFTSIFYNPFTSSSSDATSTSPTSTTTSFIDSLSDTSSFAFTLALTVLATLSVVNTQFDLYSTFRQWSTQKLVFIIQASQIIAIPTRDEIKTQLNQKFIPIGLETLQRMLIMEVWRNIWLKTFSILKGTYHQVIGEPYSRSMWRRYVPTFLRLGIKKYWMKAIEKRIERVVVGLLSWIPFFGGGNSILGDYFGLSGSNLDDDDDNDDGDNSALEDIDDGALDDVDVDFDDCADCAS